MKMSSQYKFTETDKQIIRTARKQNKNKRTETRLKALELRANGEKANAIAEKTGFHPAYISQLTRKYRDGGIEAIVSPHYGGNRRNMSIEEETKFLEPFREKALKGQVIVVSEIEEAYKKAVGHTNIGGSQIYKVLKRHGWRKIMPRSRHPKQASAEDIASSKKLTQKSRK